MNTLGQMMRGWRKSTIDPETGVCVTADKIAAHLSKSRTTIFLWESDAWRADPVDIRRYGEFLKVPEEQITEALDLRSRPLEESGSAA